MVLQDLIYIYLYARSKIYYKIEKEILFKLIFLETLKIMFNFKMFKKN